MKRDSARVETGLKVAVIGGGPAGSFFALYLLQYAEQRGIVRPEVTIYQERAFDERGPRGCKGCAGILSMSLLRNLDELSLTIPGEIIQNKIEQYTVHSAHTAISISNPEKGIGIVSIYRGNGPLQSAYENPISFDGWLLRQAQSRGARVVNEAVSRIYPGDGTGIEVAGGKLDYDLVVLASGVNAKPVPVNGLGYVPPETRVMAQDELYAGAAEVESRLGNVAHAFLIPRSRVIFGTLVPKGPFINVSVLSSGARPVSVTDFLKLDMVRRVLPEHYERVCGCRPRAAVGRAYNHYADGFVAIGDAAVSRLYKDGIGSSLLTAREAARTVVRHGIARRDFKRYYQPLCNSIVQDNRWGRLLFLVNDRTKDSRVFLVAQARLIGNEQSNVRGPQPFTRAAWGMFTGSYSYQSITGMTFGPFSFVKLSGTLLVEGARSLLRRGDSSRRELYVGGRKVLILGSGFGGTYALRRLVPSLNRNENVQTTMVSDENFFLFTPLLHEVAMGRVETRHIAYPIRRIQWRDRFNFVQASVEKIDLAERKVMTSAGTMEYDHLVLALGGVSNISALDTAGGNAFTLKTLRDSMLIRNHIIEVFERASTEEDVEKRKRLLTFVVSGAGYTGVQAVSELRDFVRKDLPKFYKSINPAEVRIVLVEAQPKIIADLHTRLGAYVMKHLQEAGIEVWLKSRVTFVEKDYVKINGIVEVPTSTLIWVAGLLANPRIAELDVEKDSLGRVRVNEYMEVDGVPGVYAVGDCARFEDPKTGKVAPPRAHMAVRQARVAAHNILSDIRGTEKKRYRFSDAPEIVTLGASKAVFRFRGLRLYGFPARLIWLVAYTLLVTGAYNRTRIVMDWLLSLIFGRDTTFLKLTE